MVLLVASSFLTDTALYYPFLSSNLTLALDLFTFLYISALSRTHKKVVRYDIALDVGGYLFEVNEHKYDTSMSNASTISLLSVE